MAYHKIRLFVFILLVFVPLYSQNIADIYSEVLVKYSAINDFKAEFLQENYWHDLDTFKQSEGNIYFDENHLLLAYNKPDEQRLLIDHDSIWIYEPAANQVYISNNIENDIRPVNFISKYWDISKKTIEEFHPETIRIKLITPEKEKIFITLKNYLITDILIVDTAMNSVHYSFSHIKTNSDFPKNIFKLTLPEDVNIIDTRIKK